MCQRIIINLFNFAYLVRQMSDILLKAVIRKLFLQAVQQNLKPLYGIGTAVWVQPFPMPEYGESTSVETDYEEDDTVVEVRADNQILT